MQTDLLTLLQPTAAVGATPVAAGQTATAPPGVDFGAFLLALLAVESAPPVPPVTTEADQSGQLELSEGAIDAGLALLLQSMDQPTTNMVELSSPPVDPEQNKATRETSAGATAQVRAPIDLAIAADLMAEVLFSTASTATALATVQPPISVELTAESVDDQPKSDVLGQIANHPSALDVQLAALTAGKALFIPPNATPAKAIESALGLELSLPAGETLLSEAALLTKPMINQSSGMKLADYAIAVPQQVIPDSPPAHQFPGADFAKMGASDEFMGMELPEMTRPDAFLQPQKTFDVPAGRLSSVPGDLFTLARTNAANTGDLQKIVTVFPGTEVQSLTVSPGTVIPSQAQGLAPVLAQPLADGLAQSDPVVALPASPIVPAPVATSAKTQSGKAPSAQPTLTKSETLLSEPVTAPVPSKPASESTAELLKNGVSGKPQVTEQATFSSSHEQPTAPTGGERSTGPESVPRVQFILEHLPIRPALRPAAEILLRVQPDTLGTVRLQLRTVDNHLAARIVVQSPQARQAVESSLPELQRTLADAGLIIDRFAVTVAQTANSGHADPDMLAQKRRYAFKTKANRRYQEAAGVQKSTPAGGLPIVSLTGGGVRLNLVA